MVLESFEDNQSYSLIKLVNTNVIVNNKILLLNLPCFLFQLFENCKHILKSTIETLQDPIDDNDFVKREKELIYIYLNYDKHNLKSSSLMYEKKKLFSVTFYNIFNIYFQL